MENIKIYLSKTEKTVLDKLSGSGFAAYTVGGCLRDRIMGILPGDVDITTSALPEQVKEVFSGYTVVETGIKHGTVTVIVEGEPVEITTFRKEEGYTDNRHPDKVRLFPA
ncbi:MAG: hypothetical protein MJ091_06920 [Clostridia bacterium]|nr:hypothetical protein [Clostridia bacterium]